VHFCFKNIFGVFYLITFAPECFALAVAAVSAELRAILLNKISKILQLMCHFVNSVRDGQFCAKKARAESQNSGIPSQY